MALSVVSRSLIALRAGVTSLRDPMRQDQVAIVGEATGTWALRAMYRAMLADPTGRRILRDRPVVNSQTLLTEQLRALPLGSFGHTYMAHMEAEHITADSRAPVTLIDDDDLAYVMRRYREVHDFLHVLTDLPITVEGELALKAFEAIQTGLPMAYLAVLVGPMRLQPHERQRLFGTYVPWAARTAASAPYYLNMYFEEHLADPLDELRRRMGIQPAPKLAT